HVAIAAAHGKTRDAMPVGMGVDGARVLANTHKVQRLEQGHQLGVVFTIGIGQQLVALARVLFYRLLGAQYLPANPLPPVRRGFPFGPSYQMWMAMGVIGNR